MEAAGLILTSYQNSLVRQMDVVANNVANINTTGFKRQEVEFETYMVNTTPSEKWAFSVDSGTFRDTAQGPSVKTGNPLDIAIQGDGYFPIETPNGKRYTRAGAFMLNSEGEVVTPDGYKLLGDGDQAITLPSDASDVLVAGDGTISVMSGTGASAVQVGKLSAVMFKDEQAMQNVGDSFYATTQSPEPNAEAHFTQGAIEQSNVSSVREVTHMIEVSRSYQQIVHLLELEHQRQNSAIDKLGRATV